MFWTCNIRYLYHWMGINMDRSWIIWKISAMLEERSASFAHALGSVCVMDDHGYVLFVVITT
jgi:hypothetical protein